ncbi:sugar diacid utilization regulator [Bacillus pakistanensis]|uniref:Sugar diacid utilization regulator n=1 Tax=Rossellomorea pakistanensis TaxID=992288 RepID=A0ABS2NEX0_9BACI|nr:helix-turn-helix domain-containing protein [Bacillus pakistanensis]MBM7586401.1 sugar diacid utilization regulator [Bacillus pakistanensis]
MLKQLLKKYPNSIHSENPVSFYPNDHLWLKVHNTKQYIGIPKTDLTIKETELLQTLFEEWCPISEPLNKNTNSIIWYEFLYQGNSVDVHSDKLYRTIHFSLKDTTDFSILSEAMEHLFSENGIVIFESESNGCIIEEHSQWNITEEQLLSSIQVLESDLYTVPQFFIGKFYPFNSSFISLFRKEEELFNNARERLTSKRIHSLESILPHIILEKIPLAEKKEWFHSIEQTFIEDPELVTTIKTYLENHSNTTQTAKALFMHRNSVQYRIDKFIEKSGLDIKSFQGALTSYLGCLFFQKNNLPNK